MEFFESKYVYPNLPKDVLWYRYVDDVLCIWPENNNYNSFLTKLNSFVESIEFTIEVEDNSCIPFLDILIHRKSSGFYFDVYRKPTNNCLYVHNFSNHDITIKRQTFYSMFLRSLRIVSPEYFDLEMSRIYDIGYTLKYDRNFIENCFYRAKKYFYSFVRREDFSFQNILKLPFSYNFVNLVSIFKVFNITLVFTYENTVKKTLVNNSVSNTENCGVYKINCIDCESFYIGQTARFKERISEHRRDIRNGNDNKSLFCHLRDFNHQIDFINCKIIKNVPLWIERNVIESIIIKATFDSNINDRLGLYTVDPYLSKLIADEIKLEKIIS